MLVSRDVKGGFGVSALVVRCGVKGGAINISKRAYTIDFDSLVKRLGLDPVPSGLLRDKVIAVSLAAVKAVEAEA